MKKENKSLTPLVCFTLLLFAMIQLTACNDQKAAEHPHVEQYKKFISEMNARGFSTGNILVYEDEKVIFEHADGLRSIEPMDSLTLDAQFRIASVSKQFTGVAIMKLKQAGKLEYSQKVSSILVDFPYEKITVEHLLRHISGLPDYEEIVEEHFVPQDSSKRYILGNEEILKLYYAVNPKLNFEPGEAWEYSNTGYMVLASLVEEVSGQHFSAFLKENIFDPLQMNNTLLYDYREGNDPQMPQRVFGYRRAVNQKDLVSCDYDIVNDVRGDGGIYSTLRDLYTWNLALINYEVLPKEYMDEAWSWGRLNNGEKTRYGFGWKFLKDTTAVKTVFHAGGWAGFGTYLYNEVETRSGYVVLTNNSWESVEAVTDAIDSIRRGAPYVLQNRSMGRDMLALFFEQDLDAAIDLYHRHKLDSNEYDVDVFEIQNLGYELLDNELLNEALRIFELNIKEYPHLPNTYAGYADALSVQGDTTAALENYIKALNLDPNFDYAQRRITALNRP